MAKIKKPAPKNGGPAKPAPAKKPMRRKSRRVTALPHVDVTALKPITAEAAGKEMARLAAEVMSAVSLTAPPPKRGWFARFRSAVSGLFVSKKYAEANPATTVREKVRK